MYAASIATSSAGRPSATISPITASHSASTSRCSRAAARPRPDPRAAPRPAVGGLGGGLPPQPLEPFAERPPADLDDAVGVEDERRAARQWALLLVVPRGARGAERDPARRGQVIRLAA